MPRPYALVHNAGVMPPERVTTDEGHELASATHVLGLAPRDVVNHAMHPGWADTHGVADTAVWLATHYAPTGVESAADVQPIRSFVRSATAPLARLRLSA